MATGTYFLQTWGSVPYLDELYNGLACPAGNCTVTSGMGVVVTAGTTTNGIDFALAMGGTIAGKVIDAGTGAPLANVTIYVHTASGSFGGQDWTDTLGAYTIAGLATGNYYVETANSPGYVDELYNDLPCAEGCTRTSGTGVSVVAGTTTSGIDFGLALPPVTPVITWATPAAITQGTALGGTQLNASAGVPGSVVYTPPAGTVLAAGTHTLSVTFTPTNATLYTTASKAVTLVVNASGGGGTFQGPSSGGPATGSVSGSTLTYNGATYPIVGGKVTFPDCTVYIAMTSGMLIPAGTAAGCTPGGGGGGSPVTPTVTWATPAAITQGTPLSTTQLNASAGVPGSVVYTPPAGTVLAVGTHTLSVTFTPADATLYTTASKTVTLVVNASGGGGTFQGPSSGGPATGSVSGSTLTYNGAAYPIVGGKVTFPDCTVYIAMTSGMLIPAGTAAGCTPGGGGGGSPVTPTVTWATPAAITPGDGAVGDAAQCERQRAGQFRLHAAGGDGAGGGDAHAVGDLYARGHDALHDGQQDGDARGQRERGRRDVPRAEQRGTGDGVGERQHADVQRGDLSDRGWEGDVPGLHGVYRDDERAADPGGHRGGLHAGRRRGRVAGDADGDVGDPGGDQPGDGAVGDAAQCQRQRAGQFRLHAAGGDGAGGGDAHAVGDLHAHERDALHDGQQDGDAGGQRERGRRWDVPRAEQRGTGDGVGEWEHAHVQTGRRIRSWAGR